MPRPNSPSPRRLLARSCLLPAASALAFSFSFSFSSCSAWRAERFASALAFFRWLVVPPDPSSESSSSEAALAMGGSSDARRCRLDSGLLLPQRQLLVHLHNDTLFTHSSLSASLPRLPARRPLPPWASRLLCSMARRNCSSSSSCSLLRIVPLLLPVAGSTLAREAAESLSFFASFSLLLTEPFRAAFGWSGR